MYEIIGIEVKTCLTNAVDTYLDWRRTPIFYFQHRRSIKNASLYILSNRMKINLHSG